MKIERAGYQAPKTGADVARDRDAAGFGAALNAGVSPQSDFAQMSRSELFDWMNDRIKDGKLSMDDSTGILSLTGAGSFDPQAADKGNGEKVNFFQIAQDGIAAARHRKDGGSAAIYQSALLVLQRFQAPR
ncbi:hypothetical protein [Sphingopyxis sp.]|uniref:hypothetical protein n=1 Tax=Sphingopyxis sp. TaxID=1908224 RepID=UPI003D1180AE